MSTSSLRGNITAVMQLKRTLQTWSGSGNTFTITDPDIKADSLVLFFQRASYAGRWYVSTVTSGTSFVITSTSAEVTNPTFYYVIL